MKEGGGKIKIRITQISIIICISILIASLYILIRDFLEYNENNESNKKLIENVIVEKKVEQDGATIDIDWKELKKINKDIIGWIRIENTNIDYPILQDDNNLKYIKHSFDGKSNSNGSIFTINQKPFIEDITVIYGHNMKNGSMFSDLSKYMDQNFCKQHSVFQIYTENKKYKATIFSCYSIGVAEEENNIKLLDFNQEIEYYKNKSNYFIENIDNITKVVKLSTCSYINNHTTPTNQRYYIVAKLEEII